MGWCSGERGGRVDGGLEVEGVVWCGMLKRGR